MVIGYLFGIQFSFQYQIAEFVEDVIAMGGKDQFDTGMDQFGKNLCQLNLYLSVEMCLGFLDEKDWLGLNPAFPLSLEQGQGSVCLGRGPC